MAVWRVIVNRPDLFPLQSKFPWPDARPNVSGDWGPNWFSQDAQGSTLQLFQALVPRNARTIVELGSLLGRSARGWLSGFPQAHVICIDTWRGSPEHQDNPNLRDLLPRLLPTFQVNLWDQRERVTSLPATTLEGLRTLHQLAIQPDAIYVDADHSTESVFADVSLSLDLFPSAQIIGHDWTRPTVRSAVERIAQQRGLQILAIGNLWWFPPPVVSADATSPKLVDRSTEKVITMTLFRRPQYTREVLRHLLKCDGIDDYRVIIHIEPGTAGVLQAASEAAFARKIIVENADQLGCTLNTRCAIEHGFQWSDYVIHFEDDTVPSRDCLRYFEWARGRYQNDPQIFSVCAYSKSRPDSSRYHAVRRTPWFTPWGWATWQDRWDEILPRLAAKAWGHRANETRGSRCELQPLLARVQNIGAEFGAHCPSPDFHQKHQYNAFGAWSVEPLDHGTFHEVRE